MSKAPAYNVGDVVYLIESAKVGSLESYQISEVRQSPDGKWIYKISIPQRPPNKNATYGDRITLRKSIDFELTEEELGSYCEAVDIAIDVTEAILTRLKVNRQAHCEPDTEDYEGSESGTA